ncbi:hypothetical protein V1527DRAFT_453977 [Lipomyces starkeyi]
MSTWMSDKDKYHQWRCILALLYAVLYFFGRPCHAHGILKTAGNSISRYDNSYLNARSPLPPSTMSSEAGDSEASNDRRRLSTSAKRFTILRERQKNLHSLAPEAKDSLGINPQFSV